MPRTASHAPLAGTLGMLGHIEAEPQSLLEDRPTMPGTPRLRMTRWFDPIERFRTSGHAKRARKHDDRESTADAKAHDADPILRRYEADESGSFWFDYVADLGDAFDPTMEIAWTLGRRSVTFVPEGSGSSVPLHRGPLLVLGGDEVYPYGTADYYRDQTVLPYALGRETDAADVGADVLAIPGNHDWWGGLDLWRAVFCGLAPFGRWRTIQRDSWWAAQLPHGWWIWGMDTFLDGSINPAQQAYFDAAAEQLQPDDRVILCTPIPLWRLRESHPERLVLIDRLVDDCIRTKGATAPVFLAGDSHLFAVYHRQRDAPGSTPTAELHVTAGGGGAFAQGTHHHTRVVPEGDIVGDAGSGVDPAPFTDGVVWPSAELSRRHLHGRLGRALADRQSVSLGAALGFLHAAYGAGAGMRFRHRSVLGGSNGGGVGDVARALLVSWPGVVWSVGALLLFLKFGLGLALPDTGARSLKWTAKKVGAWHGLAQFAGVVSAATIAHLLVRPSSGQWPAHAGLRVAALGGALGGALSVVILVAYLVTVNQRYRINGNESFAVQHFGDLKQFLRLVIDADGALTVRMIAYPEGRVGWAEAYRSGPCVPPGSEVGRAVTIADVPWAATVP